MAPAIPAPTAAVGSAAAPDEPALEALELPAGVLDDFRVGEETVLMAVELRPEELPVAPVDRGTAGVVAAGVVAG